MQYSVAVMFGMILISDGSMGLIFLIEGADLSCRVGADLVVLLGRRLEYAVVVVMGRGAVAPSSSCRSCCS